MQATRTLQSSIDFASIYCRLQPLTNVGGIANEPGLTICNMVAQIILGAPMKWRWNRTTLTTTTTANDPDVTLTVSGSGLSVVEKAWISSPVCQALDIRNSLGTETATGRPTFIAPMLEGTASSDITFTLMPTPDQEYTISVIGQNAPPLFTSLSDTWSPIPDYMAYIYDIGVLAMAMLYTEHPGFQIMFSRFLASLAGAAEGLNDQERSLFIGNYQYLLQAQRGMANAQLQGDRGLYGVQA